MSIKKQKLVCRSCGKEGRVKIYRIIAGEKPREYHERCFNELLQGIYKALGAMNEITPWQKNPTAK